MSPSSVTILFFILSCAQGIYSAVKPVPQPGALTKVNSTNAKPRDDSFQILQSITSNGEGHQSANVKFLETIKNIESANDILTKLILSEKGLDMPASAPLAVPRDFKYVPTWESLDARPLPAWYDEAKVGIFIHWGVFSVPSFRSEWFWKNWENPNSTVTKFMERNYKPGFTYQDFAKDFTAEFFDANHWADILASSGAKYVVLTSKHHEGYTLWPSKYAFSWNSMDIGPKRDLVGELATAVRRRYSDIHFGLYHSLYEWFNPLYVQDKANNFTTNQFVTMKTLPELIEIVQKYQPEVIWSDGEWEAPAEYWKSREFLAWLYNESPVKNTVVVNDRWCNTCLCKHGGYLTCEDKYNPGKFQSRKFENCFTLDKYSWGYRRDANIDDILNMTEVLQTMMNTVSFGGNVLINIGPTKEGTISPIFQERLRDIGKYTTKKESDKLTLYATFVNWPKDDELSLPCVTIGSGNSVYLLGYDGQKYSLPLRWDKNAKGITVHLPKKSLTLFPWAWTLKFVNIGG
ncbi:hypothetical protein M8J76_016600 [Diaphorina citri]|nr:hypothetical protein M8J76_016600 [Diaphorina citri]